MIEEIQGEYDTKALIKYAAILVALIAACKVTGGLAVIVVPFLVVIANARGRVVEVLFWIVFMLYFSFANPRVCGKTPAFVLTTRVTLVLVTCMLAGSLFSAHKREARIVSPMWGIFIYAFWEALISGQGWEPTVSYLKLALFFFVFVGLIAVANRVNLSTRANAKLMRSALLAVICVIIFGSVLLVPFGIGLMGAEEVIKAMMAGERLSLFCGMTNHSQALGPTAAILGVFIFADMIFSIKKFDKLYLALLISACLVLYKSSSRTGMATLVAGCGMAWLMAIRSQGIGTKWKLRMMTGIGAFALIAGIGAVAIPSVRDGVAQFVLKYGDDTKNMTTEDVLKSRQGKLDGMYYNIAKKPLIGNGFQVSEEMEYEHRSGFLAYLSAPVEKSTWVVAVVEEGGAIGMILLCGWIVFAIGALIKRHAYIGASMFVTLLVCNMGEFSMFSMSYTGGLYWGMVFAGLVMDVQRMKGVENFQVFEVPMEVVVEEEGMDAWTERLG